MPRIDISFINVRVFDINSFEVKLQEAFTLESDYPPGIQWFSNNDSVLAINVVGSNAYVVATGIGYCTILLMDSNQQILKQLNIKVVDAITPVATNLELTADPPQAKP